MANGFHYHCCISDGDGGGKEAERRWNGGGTAAGHHRFEDAGIIGSDLIDAYFRSYRTQVEDLSFSPPKRSWREREGEGNLDLLSSASSSISFLI